MQILVPGRGVLSHPNLNNVGVAWGRGWRTEESVSERLRCPERLRRHLTAFEETAGEA